MAFLTFVFQLNLSGGAQSGALRRVCYRKLRSIRSLCALDSFGEKGFLARSISMVSPMGAIYQHPLCVESPEEYVQEYLNLWYMSGPRT
jgi:hypothetical protein